MRKIKIHLTGKLKEICDNQEVVEMGAQNARMAIRALQSRFGDAVKQHVIKNKWHLLQGSIDKKNALSERQVEHTLTSDDLYIIPAVEGSSGRLGRAILGIVLVVAGVVIAPVAPLIGSSLISTGVGLVLQAFFAPDVPAARERPEERPSFLFSGATNTSQQGQPVPLVFGRFRTGSAVVSVGLDAEQLMSYDTPVYPGDGNSGDPFVPPDVPWWPQELN